MERDRERLAEAVRTLINPVTTAAAIAAVTTVEEHGTGSFSARRCKGPDLANQPFLDGLSPDNGVDFIFWVVDSPIGRRRREPVG